MIAAILSSLLWFGAHQPTVQTKKLTVKPWTVTVKTDRFTGTTRCSARSSDVIVEGPLAVFNLGAGVDAAETLYRLDLGPAQRAQGSNIDEAIAFDAAKKPRLTSATGGRLGLPSAELVGVRRLDIGWRSDARIRTFDISALSHVRDVEIAAGCQNVMGEAPSK